MRAEPDTGKSAATRNTGELAELLSVYERLSPEIRGTLQRILQSPQDAEEVLETVFLEFEREGRLAVKAGASPDAWLILAARAAGVQRLRADKGWRVLGIPDSRTLAPWLPAEETMSALRGRKALLERSIAQLPAAQRALLDAVIFRGRTETEIAAELREPLGKVQDQVRAALAFTRQRLRTLLGTWTAGI